MCVCVCVCVCFFVFISYTGSRVRFLRCVSMCDLMFILFFFLLGGDLCMSSMYAHFYAQFIFKVDDFMVCVCAFVYLFTSVMFVCLIIVSFSAYEWVYVLQTHFSLEQVAAEDPVLSGVRLV